jgi:hypothetical protein
VNIFLLEYLCTDWRVLKIKGLSLPPRGMTDLDVSIVYFGGSAIIALGALDP